MAYQKSTVVKIQGGLGNQLFQYAFAVFLKKNLEAKIDLDLSWFENQNLREFQLNQVLINVNFNQVKLNIGIFNKILNYKSELLITYLAKHKYFFPIKIYNGYWQDVFFANHLKDINYFNNNIFLKKYSGEYYVLHLRRGDFFTSNLHTVIQDEHYQRFVNLFIDKKIYIISNDKESALVLKEKLNSLADVEYIECGDIEAFGIIYNAKGGIASNSTFCWWPIYLSGSQNWIMPYHWLKNKNIFDQNLNIDGTLVL